MELNLERITRRVPITVLHVVGNLDATSFRALIERAQSEFNTGMRDLLIDLGECPYVSSAGLVALHSIIKLMRGEPPLDPEAGWASLHAIAEDSNATRSAHVKLCCVQPKVERVLDLAGFKSFVAIFDHRDTALDSF
jgi:anti-anti-sigma regulatory factor